MAARVLRAPCFLPFSLHLNVTRTLNPISRAVPRLNQLYFHSSAIAMAPANGDNGDSGSTEGELNQWKFRAPYKIHENDPNFHVRYEGSCHCGKVRYQLSREKPLDAKFCHCTTCQKLHGQPQNHGTPLRT